MQYLDAFRCTCIHNEKKQQHLQIKTLPYPTWYPPCDESPWFFRPVSAALPVVSMGPNLITTDFRPDPPTTKGGTISIVPKIDQNCHLKRRRYKKKHVNCEHMVKKHIMVKK